MSEAQDYQELADARSGLESAVEAMKKACDLNEADAKEEILNILHDCDIEMEE